MTKRISFTSANETLVGTLYHPEGPSKAAVVLTGPLTSVKEQAAGAYAEALAAQGFAALAFDHQHFGESGGSPRQYENPEQKVKDIRAAVAALQTELPGRRVFALGVCAGAGYMAAAVAQEPAIMGFAGVAGFYHDAAQSREWMGEGYEAAIEVGAKARAAYDASGEASMIPAVAPEGDRAMPMDEALAYYGTDRGGEARFANYKNAFALMSKEKTTPFDAQGAARNITQPVLMIHSENALSPMLARRFFQALPGTKESHWMESTGQIDFYDDPARINPAVERIARFFESLT